MTPDLPLASRLRALARWETGLVVLAVAIVVLGASTSEEFLTSRNFFYMGLNVGEVAIMALPMTLIIVTGEIDLSVASTLGMASALLGFLWNDGLPMPLIIVIVLAVGALAGLFNGLLVTRIGLPSLAVTIGTLTLYRGVALILLGPNTVSTFPASYTTIGIAPVPGTDLPYSIAIFIVLAVACGILLHATPVGRAIFAIGANTQAATFSGVRVKRIKTLLFVTSGVLSSLAGILFTFRLATAISNNGIGLELSVVAVVLFAGVSIFGGRGTVIGVVLALFTFAAIQSALLLTNFDQRAAGIVTGGLLLVSVLIPNVPALADRVRRSVSRPSRPADAPPAGPAPLDVGAEATEAEQQPDPAPHGAGQARQHSGGATVRGGSG